MQQLERISKALNGKKKTENSTFCTIPFISSSRKKQNYSDRKPISGCQKPTIKGGNWWQRGKGIFLGDENILYHDCGGWWITIYICQNSSIVYLKSVKFIVCKLYLKADFKNEKNIA